MKKTTLAALAAPLVLSTFLSAAGPVDQNGQPLGSNFEPLATSGERVRMTYIGITGRRSLSIFFDAEASPAQPGDAMVHLNCRQLSRRVIEGAIAQGMARNMDEQTIKSLNAQQAQYHQAVKALGCPVIEV